MSKKEMPKLTMFYVANHTGGEHE